MGHSIEVVFPFVQNLFFLIHADVFRHNVIFGQISPSPMDPFLLICAVMYMRHMYGYSHLISAHWGDCNIAVKVSWERALLRGRHSIFIVQVFWETGLWLNMIVLLRRWSSKDHWLMTLGKDPPFSLFRSPGRQTSSVECYLECGLEKAIHQWHWGILCTFIVQVFWETKHLLVSRVVM